jgi:hypothetical protein
MSSSGFTVGRTTSALVIAVAAIAGPVAVGWAATSGGSVHFLGDTSDECTATKKPGDTSLSCKPIAVTPGGASSETALTDSNSSIDYGPKNSQLLPAGS